MDSRSPINMNAIVLAIILISSIIIATALGQRAASGDIRSLAIFFGAALCMTVVLMAGKKYWLLIPLTGAFSGSIGILPVPFSYAELGTIAAVGMYVLHLCLKQANFGFRIRRLDLFLIINLAYLVTVWVRNPAGFLFANSDIIGARPYFTIIMNAAAYIVLSQQSVGEKLGRRFIYIMAVPAIMTGALSTFTLLVPSASRVIYPFYTGVNIEAFGENDNSMMGDDPQRITGFADLANPIIQVLCSVYRPLNLITPTHVVPFTIFMAAMVMIGLSGFRNRLIATAGYMAIASALRRKTADIVVLGACGALAILTLAAVHVAGLTLPFTFQRALSFIPFIDWDPNAVADAQTSSQWRFDMWHDAWYRPGIIRNKLLGDGFGFRVEDFRAMQDQLLSQGIGFLGAPVYEAHLVMGSFHSGPLSAIRFAGIVGLILFLILMYAAARESARLVQEAENTPYHTWAIFLSLPLIYQVFEYIFVFGAYNAQFPAIIISIGYLRLLDNSIRKWKQEKQAVASTPSQNAPKVIGA